MDPFEAVSMRLISYFFSFLTCLIATSNALSLRGSTYRAESVLGQTVTMDDHSELHLTGLGSPLSGSTVHLNSEDAWLFFHSITPAEVISGQLSRVRVNGLLAKDGVNVRVVQHAQGSVVIPHDVDFRPLRVHTAQNFTGQSRDLSPHILYRGVELGGFAQAIRSFVLKRGWMVCFANNESGTENSRVFIAQDSDLEIPVLSSELDRKIRFVRVAPWRWVSKKGTCDTSPDELKAQWHYNWNISLNSTSNWEYAAIKQQPYWPGLNHDWKVRGVNHLSGFNEPNNPVEDAYKNLTPQGSYENAAARWPELLGTGLRIGAPAVTDGGLGWLNGFMSEVRAAGYRVDYVPVHYYRSYWNKTDPQGAANQMYNFLKSVHDATNLPVWVTEFNNGANWTDSAHDPSASQNRDAVQAMIRMMDSTPWVERYAVYSRVEWFRQTHYDDGSITPMGAMYRDHQSPIGHQQVIPNMGKTGVAYFPYDESTRDSSGNGNVSLTYGTPSFVTGKMGQALSFDGDNDYLKMTGRFGDSGDFTFASWVKWDGGGNWQRVFDFGDGTDRYLFLTPKSGSNTLRFAIKNGGSEQIVESSALSLGVWTHVAVSLSGNTGKLFVNGSLVDTNTSMTINPSDLGTEVNYLGKSQFVADPLFDGSLDELRIYNYALADSAIAGLASNAHPEFSRDANPDLATAHLTFVGSVAQRVTGGVGPLRFEKVDGPGWLSLGADGSYSGLPHLEDIGLNEVLLRVTDRNGNQDTVIWLIDVASPDPVARFSYENHVEDVLGNVNGQFVGSATFGLGYEGRGLQFDGIDDHLVLGQGIASSDQLTIASWVKWNGGAVWQRIFDFGNGTDSYLFLSPKSGSNRLRFAIKNSGAEEVIEAPALQVGVWTHVAVTLGEGVGKLYVNGSLVGSNQSFTIRPSDVSPRSNYLGKSQWPDPLFRGMIDEFHVFPRELTAQEVVALKNAENSVVATSSKSYPAIAAGEVFSVSLAGEVIGDGGSYRFQKLSGPVWLNVEQNGCLSGIPNQGDVGNALFRIQVVGESGVAEVIRVIIPVEATDDLVAHYQFQGNASDLTGRWHGSIFGSPDYPRGWNDQIIFFDGENDYVQLPTGMISNLSDVTFATRFRWDGGGSWQRVFDFGNNTSQYIYLTPSSNAGTLRFGITINGSGASQLLDGPRPRSGEWVHVAVTLKGSLGSLYVNGVEADTATITLNPSHVAPTRNYFGESQWPDPRFHGAIDDFRIYDRALSATEIRALAIPPEPVEVVSAYALWASEQAFESSQEDWSNDADGDGSANVFEWLAGTNPLDAFEAPQISSRIVEASELGLDRSEKYFLTEARVLKDRAGFRVYAEGSINLNGFGEILMLPAGLPVDDGDYEVLRWYFRVPIGTQERAFVRLKAVAE